MKKTKTSAPTPKISVVLRRQMRPMTAMPIRAGGLDMLEYPSRMGGTLVYPDGRVVKE